MNIEDVMSPLKSSLMVSTDMHLVKSKNNKYGLSLGNKESEREKKH